MSHSAPIIAFVPRPTAFGMHIGSLIPTHTAFLIKMRLWKILKNAREKTIQTVHAQKRVSRTPSRTVFLRI
jgi:hypothetical protein